MTSAMPGDLPDKTAAVPMDASDGIRPGAGRVVDAGHGGLPAGGGRMSDEDFVLSMVSGLTDEQAMLVLSRFTDQATVKLTLTARKQQAIAEATDKLDWAANRHLDGLKLDAVVSLDAFNFWLARRDELGENPWDFDEFWEELKRDNPEVRVRQAEGPVIIPGWDGGGKEAAA